MSHKTGEQRPYRRLTDGMGTGVATVERASRVAGHTAEAVLGAARRLPRDLPDLMKEGQAYLRGLSGYVYGLPLVLMDVTREVMTAAPRSGEYSAPINQFHRLRDFVDPDFKNVVRISRNSLWSTAFVDLRDEPVVFSYPETHGRYVVAQIMNMWTDNFASMGTRTTGTAAGKVVIAGPGWDGRVPSDVDQTYRCSTRYAWILVQMAAAGPQDFDELHAMQDELRVTPLSAWGTPYQPPQDVAVDLSVDTGTTPFDQVRLMDGPAFFARLASALKDNPPYASDTTAIKRLEQIGLIPGEDLDVDRMDAAVAKGLTRAAKKVWGTLETAPYSMKTVNGWLIPLNLGRYGEDYKMRAFISYVGLGALCREDAVYPTCFVDRDGKPLNGAREYVLHLDKEELFPSHSGIWSISAYRESFYVHNPIERYGITSGMPLVYNADGSLDMYIQARSPGEARESNWLPCPRSGPFNLTIRVYHPNEDMFEGRAEGNLLVEARGYAIPPVVAAPR